MALAGLLSSLRAAGLPQSALTQQRIVIMGAGTAGLGVASSIKYGMMQVRHTHSTLGSSELLSFCYGIFWNGAAVKMF
jgi:malic enzyme